MKYDEILYINDWPRLDCGSSGLANLCDESVLVSEAITKLIKSQYDNGFVNIQRTFRAGAWKGAIWS